VAELTLFVVTAVVCVGGWAALVFLVVLAVQFCRGCGLVERKDWLEDE
jgi:hypothetical protein